MIYILIVDDHAIVRKGLVEIVSDAPDIWVKGEALDGYEALRQIGEETFDLVVLDVALPGPSGLAVLEQIKVNHPDLPVLMLSIYPEQQYVMQAFRAGAAGYLTKKSAPDELITAIRMVYNGGKYLSPTVGAKIDFQAINETTKLHERLTQREFEIMLKIADGKRLKDIAEELFISGKTVSSHRTRILDKLRLQTTSEMIRYVIDNDLAGLKTPKIEG